MDKFDTIELRIGQLENTVKILTNKLNDERTTQPLILAISYSKDDPHGALNKVRIVLEKILLDVYIKEMNEEPRKKELGEMLNNNQFTRKIERRIISRMNSIRDMSNLGTHGEDVEKRDALDAIDNLCEVLGWYLEKYMFNLSSDGNTKNESKEEKKKDEKLLFHDLGF